MCRITPFIIDRDKRENSGCIVIPKSSFSSSSSFLFISPSLSCSSPIDMPVISPAAPPRAVPVFFPSRSRFSLSDSFPLGRSNGFVHFLLQLHFFFHCEADCQGFCLFSAQRFLLSHMFFAVASLIRFFWLTFSFRKEKVSGSGNAAGLLPDCVREVRRRKAVDIHALCLPRTQASGKRKKLILTHLCGMIKVHNLCKDNCSIRMLKCKHRKEMTLWKTKT